MSDKVQLIKEEIKRLKHTSNAYDRSRFMLLLEIEKFIDSLPEESTDEANCTTKNQDLDEELRKILNKYYYFPDEDDELRSTPELAKYIAYHFAKWQKQQMMKDAVDATIFSELKGSDGSLFQAKSDRFRMNGVKISDRIKIIPIKKD